MRCVLTPDPIGSSASHTVIAESSYAGTQSIHESSLLNISASYSCLIVFLITIEYEDLTRIGYQLVIADCRLSSHSTATEYSTVSHSLKSMCL